MNVDPMLKAVMGHCNPTRGWVMGACLVALVACNGPKEQARPVPDRVAAPVDVRPAPKSGVPQLSGVKWTVLLSSPAIAAPVVADGVLYVMTKDGGLRAIDTENGAERWMRKMQGGAGFSPILADSLVYVTGGKTVYALDTRTGTEKWRFKIAGTVTSRPALADGVLYVASNDGYLHAIDSQTGEKKWSFESERDTFANPFGPKVLFEVEGPAVVGDSVYFWSGILTLHALDRRTQQRRWKHSILGEGINTMSTPSAVPAGNDVYVLALNYLLALDAMTGQERWRTGVNGFANGEAVWSEGTVYFGVFGAQVRAIDAKTGHELWAAFVGPGAVSTPTVLDGIVYAAGGTDKPGEGSIALAPGDSYVPEGGWVTATDARTGQVLWTHKVEGSSIPFPACVGPSAVFVVTRAGTLLALR